MRMLPRSWPPPSAAANGWPRSSSAGSSPAFRIMPRLCDSL
jgi:hypothetical protein